MTAVEARRAASAFVMAGLDPAITSLSPRKESQTWMPGTRPGMTGDDGGGERTFLVFAAQHWFPATPANGQWPFARLVCNGADQHPKPKGIAPFWRVPQKVDREDTCVNCYWRLRRSRHWRWREARPRSRRSS